MSRALPVLGLCLPIAGCFGATDGDQGGVWFQDEAAARGIEFRHRSGFAGRHLMPEIMGGGVALVDVDGDADLDLYLVQSGSLYADETAGEVDRSNRLYFNEAGTFEQAEGGHGAGDKGYGLGVAAGDYDNDGDVDLYVTNYGPNVLLRNDGNGHFEDVTQASDVGDPGYSTAATFADLDADDDLDLFVVNYIHWDFAVERDCFIAGVLTYCPPTNYSAPMRDRLYRNNGDGTFTDTSAESGLNAAVGTGLGIASADFDGDSLTDVFVANDMMVNQLWLNRGGLRFVDEAAYRGVAVDSHGLAKSGMGVAAADADDDGDTDVLVVNLAEQTDSFYRNEGAWFVDATEAVGLATTSRRYTRFGVVLADFDNDGRLDLFEANGGVAPSETKHEGDEFAEPNTLLRGTADGRFTEVLPAGGTAKTLIHTSRGLAVGDIDDDGGLDLVVGNRDAAPYLLMNRVPNRGNWIRFRVRTPAGRDAHGATVSASIGTLRQYRRVAPEGSYVASSDPRVHFGLADETGVREVTVQWATGESESFGDFEAGRTYDIIQGGGTP
ncbi:MAG: CRTAC1 family protein [Gammaproteobacteria bacterium]|nr:CRTAC1 family protein [Gammaproteobacteria bacterium]MYF30239.1 CRTAC1 family protein [Gammaproteobacteria bacterium]MYK44773.1 CRTAC1 family protein [Gammaproteobacteria bacterium]